jgi:hypothetical protein
MSFEKINAPSKPRFEGQVIKFVSEYGAILYDVAKVNPKYGNLEWWALNEPTEYQIKLAEETQC